jgi:hypothetical protein
LTTDFPGASAALAESNDKSEIDFLADIQR